MKKALEWLLGLPIVLLVQIYRYGISPFTAPSCRYTPSCSAYTVEALKEWGPLRGGWMGLKRISSCHPWGGHGYDPVPKNPNKHR